MDEVRDINLHRAVGMSDLAMLLAEAFRFPGDDRLAGALADGSFLSDWNGSWRDACGEEYSDSNRTPGAGRANVSDRPETAFAGVDCESLRREYSRMFLSPGSEVPVWMYESAYLHRESGRTESPNLFLTRSTIDVERQMAEAGVRPEHLRTEPCDTCSTELEFVSFLYARWGESVMRVVENGGRSAVEAADVWRDRLNKFSSGHVLNWMPRFFESVKTASRIPEYSCLASLGIDFLAEMEKDSMARNEPRELG